MTKIRKKIGNIPINTIKQDLQSTVDTSVAQMQQDVTDFIDEETAQYPEIGGAFKFQEDPERRSEVTTDSEGKIISYRDADGVKHEEVGLKTKVLEADSFLLPKDTKQEVEAISVKANVSTRKFHLPKYGYANLVSETYYLTADPGYSDKNGVYPIMVYPNTQENAQLLRTCVVFYVKSTLTNNGDGTYSVNENSVALDFYAASKVTSVNNLYYVTSTLTKITDPITGEVSYEVNENSIEVTQIIDVPPYLAWPVDKKTEHYCVANIDFGYYLSGTFYIGVTYQGSSTLYNRKRNFRFTFYKNNKYEKKDKIKLGEMIKQSKFNLKANYTDSSRIKEYMMNNIFMALWEDRRGYLHNYPWESEAEPYTGATGMIKAFPMRFDIGGDFYGMQIFGLKKDPNNYMLDDDESGILVGGTLNTTDNWTAAKWQDWEDEVSDDMTEETKAALTEFFDFINSRLEDENHEIIPFDKTTVPERMSVIDWIDYFICLQVFLMLDNTCRNLMLYAASDKKKFYPFFYDLDLSWRFSANYTQNIIDVSYAEDMSLWEHFSELYWDEICNRYAELRNKILTKDYMLKVLDDIESAIPESDMNLERNAWGKGVLDIMRSKIDDMENRLNWLDRNYFKI